MLKRHLSIAVVIALAILSFVGLTASAASAQDSAAVCFPPGAGGDYPPASPGIEPSLQLSLSTGLLLPGTTTGTLTVTGALASRTYCGTLFSAPVTIPPTLSTAGGVLHFDNLTIPSDFKLNALHHLDVFRAGKLVGAFDFCVNSTGHLTTTAGCPTANEATGGGKTPGTETHGALPRTGWDHLVEVLKAAAIALALGAMFLYLRRRRQLSIQASA